MQLMLDQAGPHLEFLPDGETGDRSLWAAGIVLGLRGHPDLEVVHEGDNSDYDHQLRYRVRRGRRLRAGALDYGHTAAYRASRPVFDWLRADHSRPDLTFQVGIPGDFDMSLFTLGPVGPLRYRRPFRDVAERTIRDIHADAGDDVVFQLEVPAEQIAVAMTPSPARSATAAWAGRGIARLARRAPAGARFGVHLCLGDLAHKAMAQVRHAGPFVALANAVARHWPAGRPLEFVHVPLGAGDAPPTTVPEFYAPLARLRLPAGTRFVAGLLHEDRTLDELRAALAIIEDAVGHRVDVAAACGLGRRSDGAARRTVDQGITLCAD